MQLRTKAVLTVLAIAIPALLLGRGTPLGGWWASIWPFDDPAAPVSTPNAWQLPLFIVLSIWEAAALGLAVAFVAFAWKRTAATVGGGAWGNSVAFSATWLLGNWWMHDNLHQTNGESLTGLLVIEYAFHVTLIAAAGVLCWQWVVSTRAHRSAAAAAVPSRPGLPASR